MGATKKEYNDVVEAVKYLNQELDKTKEEGGIIQMPSDKEETTSSLSRGNGKYTTFNVLYNTYNIGTLQSLNASFTGPKTIVAEAGAASLSWSARFNEASKGISFALSGFLISSYEEREVTAPLSTPGQKTSWGWTINCGMGDGAYGYVLFKTQDYDPVNTIGSDDALFNLPIGFELLCDDYYNYDYNIRFQNYSGYSCSYEITEYIGGGFPRKGTIRSGEQISMLFSKDRTYVLKLKDSHDFQYKYSWNISSRVQI